MKAESLTVSVPRRVPVAAGVKVILMVQVAATVVSQLLVWEKSPLAVMLLMVKLPGPLLVRVICCDALGVPTVWLVNVRLAGLAVASGAVASVWKVQERIS